MTNFFLSKAQFLIAAHVFRNELPLQRETGVVSFCFDDAPRSSCVVGRQILESMDCHGTWYIAGGLTDRMEQGRLCHSVSDVQDLANSGHHIGCHTFSHKRCATLTGDEMEDELKRNADFFESIGLPSTGLDFSFPLGSFDIASKRIAARYFRSSRIIGGGIQVGSADMNALKSLSLYQHSMSPERTTVLMKEVALRRGWLMLYTHDIEDSPSRWGCTSGLLTFAVQAALDVGCKVMSVDEAIQYWSNRA